MDAPAEAAQLAGARVLTDDDRPRRGEDPLGDQDLPRLGVRAQPGGEIRDAADRRVVVPAVEADPAQGGVPLRDADAEGELVAGSLASAKGVNPRRSQKTTTISRRWLSRNDSSPESTMSSASWGERNRRNRPMRSISDTWSDTRASSSRF